MPILLRRTLFAALMIWWGLYCPTFTAAVTIDDLSMTVAYLREGKKIGTGFFVLADQPFLVTADHVANFLNPNSSITVRGANDTPINLKFADLVPDAQSLTWESITRMISQCFV